MKKSTILAVVVWLLAESTIFAQSAEPSPASQEAGLLRTLSAYAITTVTFVPYCVDMAWQIPLGGRVSWLTASVANPEPLPTDARVFLVRGSGTVFTSGFGEICSRLRRAGIWTEDLGPAGDSWVFQHVTAERRAGRLQGPIILVGHSRKSFMHGLTGDGAARDLFTIGASLKLCSHSVEILRVHDVAAHTDAYRGWAHVG